MSLSAPLFKLYNPYEGQPYSVFLSDFPIWGYWARVWRHIKKIIKKRVKELNDGYDKIWEAEWEATGYWQNETFRDIVLTVSKNICFVRWWKDCRFLPTDPFSLLFWRTGLCNEDGISLLEIVSELYLIDFGLFFDAPDACLDKTLFDFCLFVYHHKNKV